MYFQLATVAALAAISSALPTLKVRQSGPVLADTTYDAISISGGQAGNAEAEALAVFSALDVKNPGNIDAADLKFLGAVNDVANDAEVSAFNPAIKAATGADADALAAGKTKNKVLKLMATKIELEAKQAQGEDVAAKLEDETKKLNNNIATDKKNAGNPSTALPFDATVSGGGNVAAGAGKKADKNKADKNKDDAAADDSANNNDNDNDDAAAADQDNTQDATDDADNADDTTNNNNQQTNNNGNNNTGGNGSGAIGNFLFGGN